MNRVLKKNGSRLMLFSISTLVFLNTSMYAFSQTLDFNNDGVINEKDLELMLQKYNTNSSNYDFNNDGIVDILDITEMTNRISNKVYVVCDASGKVKAEYANGDLENAIAKAFSINSGYVRNSKGQIVWNRNSYWVFDRDSLVGNFNTAREAVGCAEQYKYGIVYSKFGTIVLNKINNFKAILAVTQDELNLRSQPAWSPKSDINVPNDAMVKVNRIDKGFFNINWNKDIQNNLNGYVPYYLDIIQDDNNNTMLGYVSGKEESGLNAGAISDNPSDNGGVSCGVWQFSAKMGSLGAFVLFLKYENEYFYNELNNARNSDGGYYKENFKAKWKEIANNYSAEFYKVQQKYASDKFYKTFLDICNKNGYNPGRLLNYSSTRNMIWSTSIHHGQTGAYRIFSKINPNLGMEDFIRKVYEERLNVIAISYSPNSPDPGKVNIYNAIKNRFDRECKEIIRCYQREISY